MTAALGALWAGAAVAADPGDKALEAAVAGDWRSAENRARDQYRHPAESLSFWGLKPGMSILEVQPGGGWWTEILAPYARATGGKITVTGPDLADPELSPRAREARTQMAARYQEKAELFGPVEIVNWGPKSATPPAGSFDFALISRSFHGWSRTPGRAEKYLGDLFTALKPGGILAIEQHRANPGPHDPKDTSGYLTEAFVIEQVEKAGFKLAARSEVNANPKDTKDHPFGVWTLPPMRASVAYGSGKEPDPNFDHSKYDAIGESDRMTLRFVKPE